MTRSTIIDQLAGMIRDIRTATNPEVVAALKASTKHFALINDVTEAEMQAADAQALRTMAAVQTAANGCRVGDTGVGGYEHITGEVCLDDINFNGCALKQGPLVLHTGQGKTTVNFSGRRTFCDLGKFRTEMCRYDERPALLKRTFDIASGEGGFTTLIAKVGYGFSTFTEDDSEPDLVQTVQVRPRGHLYGLLLYISNSDEESQMRVSFDVHSHYKEPLLREHLRLGFSEVVAGHVTEGVFNQNDSDELQLDNARDSVYSFSTTLKKSETGFYVILPALECAEGLVATPIPLEVLNSRISAEASDAGGIYVEDNRNYGPLLESEVYMAPFSTRTLLALVRNTAGADPGDVMLPVGLVQKSGGSGGAMSEAAAYAGMELRNGRFSGTGRCVVTALNAATAGHFEDLVRNAVAASCGC